MEYILQTIYLNTSSFWEVCCFSNKNFHLSSCLSSLDFLYSLFEISCLINWILAGYIGIKNPVQNRKRIQFFELENFINQVQIDRGIHRQTVWMKISISKIKEKIEPNCPTELNFSLLQGSNETSSNILRNYKTP